MKENQKTEFKSSWRDEYLKWICAFANAQGGILEIGKNDSGKIVTLSNIERLLEELPNKIRDILGIIAEVDLIEENEKSFLRITVEPYPNPISYKGEYYYRSGATKQGLKGTALDRFPLKKQGLHWDGVPIPGVMIEDLNTNAFKYFRQQATKSKRLAEEILKETDSGLLDKLHLTEKSYLKRSAVLLFHSEPEHFFTGSYVKIGYFKTNADLLYHNEVHGDLFSQVDNTMDILLNKYMKAIISYEGIIRVETYPVPEKALREAVMNAIAHKDYSSGTPIQISVYDDKIMIWNAGQLPTDWTVEKLLGKHSSQPYNPDVANAFFRAGMIEAWGSGIEKIINECKAATVPPPEFIYEQTGIWVVFHYKKEKDIKETTTRKTREKTREKTRVKMLAMIKSDPYITTEEMAREIGITVKGIDWQINKLKAEKKLRRIGPDRGGYWQVIED